MATANLTAERLRELLHYNPETGNFTWIKKLSSYAHRVVVGQVAGTVNPTGYIKISINGHQNLAHRLAWLYMYGTVPSIIDHINGDRRDNRAKNLRQATRSVNSQNRKAAASHSKTQILGVSPSGAKFTAHIRVVLADKSVSLYLGTYKTSDEASAVYRAAKHLMHPGA